MRLVDFLGSGAVTAELPPALELVFIYSQSASEGAKIYGLL